MALLIGFSADIDRLLQLYIVGVFVSFTLSQSGMVRHWQRELVRSSRAAGPQRAREDPAQSRSSTSSAASPPPLVLVIVLLTKFLAGAWISIIAMGVLFVLMRGVSKHYTAGLRRARTRLRSRSPRVLPSRVHAVVLVARSTSPTLRALAYARATHPHTLEALTVGADEDEPPRCRRSGTRPRARPTMCRCGSCRRPSGRSPAPLLDYVVGIRRKSPRDIVVVYVPEYVVGHWWEQILHNQTPLRIKSRLLFQPGVMVTRVPFQLDSSESGRDPNAPALGPVAHIIAENAAAKDPVRVP